MSGQLSVETHDPQSPAEWRDHITRYGYVIVHDAVPAENLQATIDDIWRHTGADPHKPESWYRRDVIRAVGMVEMYTTNRCGTTASILTCMTSSAPFMALTNWRCQSIELDSNRQTIRIIRSTTTRG